MTGSARGIGGGGMGSMASGWPPMQFAPSHPAAPSQQPQPAQLPAGTLLSLPAPAPALGPSAPMGASHGAGAPVLPVTGPLAAEAAAAAFSQEGMEQEAPVEAGQVKVARLPDGRVVLLEALGLTEDDLFPPDLPGAGSGGPEGGPALQPLQPQLAVAQFIPVPPQLLSQLLRLCHEDTPPGPTELMPGMVSAAGGGTSQQEQQLVGQGPGPQGQRQGEAVKVQGQGSQQPPLGLSWSSPAGHTSAPHMLPQPPPQQPQQPLSAATLTYLPSRLYNSTPPHFTSLPPLPGGTLGALPSSQQPPTRSLTHLQGPAAPSLSASFHQPGPWTLPAGPGPGPFRPRQAGEADILGQVWPAAPAPSQQAGWHPGGLGGALHGVGQQAGVLPTQQQQEEEQQQQQQHGGDGGRQPRQSRMELLAMAAALEGSSAGSGTSGGSQGASGSAGAVVSAGPLQSAAAHSSAPAKRLRHSQAGAEEERSHSSQQWAGTGDGAGHTAQLSGSELLAQLELSSSAAAGRSRAGSRGRGADGMDAGSALLQRLRLQQQREQLKEQLKLQRQRQQ
ncbi:hypothetical protein V8C86DRAFT_2718639 [Haematococcus lacustris]